MATSSALGTISIDGLISNFKTSELIAKLIDIERRPIRVLQQRQQDLSKQKTTWSDLMARLLSLKGMISPLTTLPPFQSKLATSSNTSVLTASASSTAAAGSYTLRVNQLALSHSVATDSHLTSETSNSLRTMLTNEGIPGAATLTSAETFSIRIGSTTKTISNYDTTSKKLSDLLTDINTQAGDLVTATVINDSPATQRLVLTSKTTGRAGEIYFTDSANGLLQKLGLLDNGTTVTGVDYTNSLTGGDATHGDGVPDPAGFTELSGVWELHGNVYDQSNGAGTSASRVDALGTLSGSNIYGNVEVSVTMNMQDDLAVDEADLMFRMDGTLSNGYTVIITGDENVGGLNKFNVELWRLGPNERLATYSYSFQNNTNYEITARAEGQNIRVLLNDAEVISFTDTNPAGRASGQVALRTIQSHSHFDNLEIRRVSAKNVLQRAQDAVFTLNNVPVISSSNTNTTAINGVTLNLVSSAPSTDVNLTVSADTASVKTYIQNYVTQYNSLINFFREQTQFSEGQKTVGSLFGNGLLLNIQSQLQDLTIGNIDPLQRTEFVGLGDGNLGDNWGDFTLKSRVTDPSDVKRVLVGTTEYVPRAEGAAAVNGGNQVEVRTNGQLRFFNNAGTAVALTNGEVINITYTPAEIVPGSDGGVAGAGNFNLTKDMNPFLTDVVRVYADPLGAGPGNDPGLFTVMNPNEFNDVGFTPKPLLPDGYYVEVDYNVSGTGNGALRFFRKFAGGDVTPISIISGTINAVYKGSNDYASLAQVGITVNDITDPTLKIDNTVLDAALTSNLQSVQELFNDYTDAVATALNDYLASLTDPDEILEDIQLDIQNEIDSIQDTINFKEEILAARQARLQKQFAKMEATLGLLQSQSVWLSQQISKLPSGFTLPGMTKSGG